MKIIFLFLFAFLALSSLVVGTSFAQQYVTAPAPVEEITAIPGNNEVLVTWVAPFNGGSTIKSYTLVMWETGKAATTTYPNLSTTNTEARITGLQNGSPYSFMVYAINDKGQSQDSKIASATPASSSIAFVPEKVTDLTATRGDGKVILTWSIPYNFGNNISSYKIYYWKVGSEEIKTKDITEDARNAQITGLENEVSYGFKIVAKSSFGQGPESNLVYSTPSQSVKADVPNRVRGVNAIPSNNQVFLSWATPSANGSPITSYQVLVSEFGSDVFTTHPNIGKDTKTTITGLTNNVKYSFKVIAVNSVGKSQPSSMVSATPENRVSIEVTNLKATRGDGSATLTWEIPPTAKSQLSGYWIREYKTGESGFTTHVFLDQTPKARITGLENGISYGFSVIAVTENGIGPASKIINITPFKSVISPEAPAKISDLKAIGGENQVILSWKEPESKTPITGYVIQLNIQGESKFTTINHGRSNSATITGLTAGVPYDFKVMARNSAGLGAESNVVSAEPISLDSKIIIPSWIKTNALWWAEDKISDTEYVQAIEYLINHGIIKIK